MFYFPGRPKGVAMLASASVAAIVAYVSPASAQEQQRTFDIPAQPLATALVEFGRQADIRVMADDVAVNGRQAPALHGTFTIDEGLDRLLAGSGLTHSTSPSGAILVPALRSAQSSGRGDQGNANSDTPLEEEAIIVTGSRVITDSTRSPTPITTISVSQIEQTTPSDIADALNKLPEIIGGRTPRTQGNASTNNGGNVLSLRNFGASRTLVLLDGHRVPASNQDGTVNVDTLPQMLVSRVDIVTGGASAIYGSDAVAGVVNFILDTDFEGFKYKVDVGESRYGDADEFQLGLAWGADLFGGRGHVETSLRHREQALVPISSRPYGADGQAWLLTGNGSVARPFVYTPYSRRFDSPETGKVNCGSSCLYNNYTFNDAGELTPLVHGIPSTNANVESGGDGAYVRDGTFRSQVRMDDWFGRLSYDFSPEINGYIQASWAQASNLSNWINWVVSPSASRPNTIFADNPFLDPVTQQQLGASIVCGTPAAAGRRCLPATPPTSPQTGTTPPAPPTTPYLSVPKYLNRFGGEDVGSTNRLYRTDALQENINFEAGLTGTFGGFDWDAFYSHGVSRLTVTNPNNTDNAKYLASLDAVIAPPGTTVNGVSVAGTIVCWVTTQPQYASLYPGCVPADITDPDGPSVSAYNYLRQSTSWTLTQVMDDIGGSIGGGLWGFGLPAGEIKANLSFDARWATYEMDSDYLPTDFVDCTGLRMCLANGGAPVRWVQNTNAEVDAKNNVYEAALELNIPLLSDVPLFQDLAASAAGRYTKYSTFSAVRSWKLGLDWHLDDNIHFRGTMSVDIRAPNLNDLYQPAGISSTGFADFLTGGNSSLRLVSRGNPNLTPEKARTVTLGFVLTPQFIPDFNLSVDFFDTQLEDAITGISYQNPAVQNICLASAPTYDSPFCSLAIRPISDPTDPDYFNPLVNFPTEVLNSPLNAAFQKTQGVDVEINYGWDMDDLISGIPGRFELRHMISYQPFNTTINLPGAFPTWQVAPKGRQTTFLSYVNEDWSVSLQNRWLSSVKLASSDNALNGNSQNYVVPRLDSNNVLDVTIGKDFERWGGTGQAYLSISNIADTRAPLFPSGAGIPNLFYPTTGYHDDMGRYFTVGVRGRF